GGSVGGAGGGGFVGLLLVVGEGPYLPTRRRVLAGPGVGASAVFLGFRHGVELARLYRGADLFLFPSCTDTLGQVVMEAQASGLPVVVTPVGGPREVIVEGRTGVVVPASEQAWVEAVLGLLGDAGRRAAMSEASRQWMRGHTLKASFQDFWSAHQEVCNRLAPTTS
ncbi:MAG: glycosyltransferase, partial [bacterium]